ncbi:XisI protein [Synechocystis salina LEGE 06099]|nr:XisI protein [Synechocystis salina LEGE 06099]
MVLWIWLRFSPLKVYWVQRDETEDGIANELVANGIPKQVIVLGFHEPSVRPHTGFAIA